MHGSMTPEQLRELADKKEAEEVVKTGILKHDLYNAPGQYRCVNFDVYLITNDQKNEIIEEFSSKFSLMLPKGTPFVCFLYEGKESWDEARGDNDFNYKDLSKEWAEKNLENITEV